MMDSLVVDVGRYARAGREYQERVHEWFAAQGIDIHKEAIVEFEVIGEGQVRYLEYVKDAEGKFVTNGLHGLDCEAAMRDVVISARTPPPYPSGRD